MLLIQAVDLFLAMVDQSPMVPVLKNKRYADLTLTPEDWTKLRLIHEVLEVSILSAQGLVMQNTTDPFTP